MHAYDHFLRDASRVLGEKMNVSLTVGFASTKDDKVVNNVGVVIVPYDAASMNTLQSFQEAFRAAAPIGRHDEEVIVAANLANEARVGFLHDRRLRYNHALNP